MNIKLCVKTGKSASETLARLQEAYGKHSMKKSSVFEWHRRFKEGREDVHDDARSGQPKTQRTKENVERVRTLLRSDGGLSVRMMAEELNMNRETVRQILTEDLGVGKISAETGPPVLTGDQKERRLRISCDLLKNEEAFGRVITGDETWCLQYDPETKRRRKTKDSPRPKNARTSRSPFKTMLVCFFDRKGIVHYEFIEGGTTASQQCYLEILKRLQESVGRERPELWPDKWVLHHDNAPARDELSVRQFLDQNSIPKLDQPPHSPDLAPCEFWLFPKLKNALKGQRFDDISDIQRAVTKVLHSIPENEFQECFRQWRSRLEKCVTSQGGYFESGDSH